MPPRECAMIWLAAVRLALGSQQSRGEVHVELFDFFKEYLASPKYVGGFAPSSRGLAEMVTDAAHVSEADVVVEFGPGTGVFTEVIARKLKKDARFFAIELREDFVKAVRKRCPGVQVHHDSATNTKKCLAEMGLEHCDCIVSGLPFTLFEDELQDEILATVMDVLKPGGRFVTFAYFISPYAKQGRKFKAKLQERFGEVDKTRIVWMNFLPAFAYCCVKPSEGKSEQ